MDPEPKSGSNGKKRRLSDVDSDNETPRTKIPREEEFEFNLLNFSDEILMHIMGYLNSSELIKLSRTCNKFYNLAADKTLWSDVDLSYKSMTGEEIKKLIFKDVCRYSEIRSLTLKGLVGLHPVEKWKNQTVTPTFLAQLSERCPHLRSITIHEACLDISKVTILNFPIQLRHFSVNRCEIICSEKRQNRRDVSFFSGINSHLKDLTRLYVENCNWFDTHDLIAFSKLPTLKELSLCGCNSFKECVPYGSIATRFGFRTLEVLDVRNTPVTDSDIQCFNMTKSLKELRLQCPEPKVNETTTTGASGEGSTTSGASSSPLRISEESAAPIPPPQPVAPAHPIERQVINVHLRRLDRGAARPNEPGVDPAPPVGNNHIPEIVREDADGAVIQAGNNNVRINIRNQNVQGRNVIHIAIRNSHNCGRNQDNNNPEAGPNNANGGEANEGEAQPNNNEANNNEVANENGDDNNARPANDNDQAPQHYIMIRGFRDEAGQDFNPARIVQFIQFERSNPIGYNPDPTTLITDRGICSFGQSNGHQPGLVWIRMESRSPTTSLERIIVRDYKYVTDNSLQHLSSCAPHLKFLDVIGTDVTKTGIEKFKLEKPECHVISNFGVFA